MTAHAPRLPLALDPLIAEAKQRMRRRRLLVAAMLAVVVTGCAIGGVFAFLSPAGTNVAGIGIFAGHWFGHTRGIDVSQSGSGSEYVSSGAAPVVTLTFKVLRVTGTSSAAEARIRVNSIHVFDRRGLGRSTPRVGELGVLQLRHGVVTDSITRVIFCAPKAASAGVCGL